MNRFLAAAILLFTGLSAGLSSWADEPPAAPRLKSVCSANAFFCAEMDPEKNLTTVYRRRAGGVREPLWSMRGWFQVAALSSDGEYLVTGYEGSNLLPLEYKKDQVMLSFYDRGKLIRHVRLNEMVLDFSKLQITVSHYHWGTYLGLNAEDHYGVETADKRWLLYNIRTGKLVE